MFLINFSFGLTEKLPGALRTAGAVAVICVPLASIAAPPGGGIYKWVDDRGGTHYSESPPEGRPSTKVRAPSRLSGGAADAPTPKSWQEKEQEFQRRRAERDEATMKGEAQAAKDQGDRTRRCRVAQNRLYVLQQQRPVYRLNAKGEREYYDDETRAREVERLKREMAESCG